MCIRDSLSLVSDMDALLATDSQFLLGTWQKKALDWGSTRQEKALKMCIRDRAKIDICVAKKTIAEKQLLSNKVGS